MILVVSGVAGRQHYCGYVAPPISTSMSINLVNVYVYDIYVQRVELGNKYLVLNLYLKKLICVN